MSISLLVVVIKFTSKQLTFYWVTTTQHNTCDVIYYVLHTFLCKWNLMIYSANQMIVSIQLFNWTVHVGLCEHLEQYTTFDKAIFIGRNVWIVFSFDSARNFIATEENMLVEILLTAIVLIVYAFYRFSGNNARYFEERNSKYIGTLTALGYNLRIFKYI